MPFKDPDPADPNMLVGVVLPADAEASREMAYVFAEEFVRLGYDRERLLRVFQNSFYAGAHGAYQALGESAIVSIVDECIDAWGNVRVSVQDVQAVQDDQTPSFVLPRVTGEEELRGARDADNHARRKGVR